MSVVFREDLIRIEVDNQEVKETMDMIDNLIQIDSEIKEVNFLKTGIDKVSVYLKNIEGFEMVFFNAPKENSLESLYEIRRILSSKQLNKDKV
jgi:hypothetical protein